MAAMPQKNHAEIALILKTAPERDIPDLHFRAG
jgi:hypothetical protein